MMCVRKPGSKRDSTLHKFKNACLRRDWYHFVRPQMKIALPSVAVSPQNEVHQLEYLLHDGILPEIIFALALELYGNFELRNVIHHSELTSCLYFMPSLPTQLMIFGTLSPPAVEYFDSYRCIHAQSS